MFKVSVIFIISIALFFSTGCSKAYKATPMSFKMPSSYNNAVNVAEADVAARAYNDASEAKKTFGFDIRGAGMLPVQVIFDNHGNHKLKINPDQTFLEDEKGNLWPILSRKIADERATKYAVENKIIKEGAKHAFWGAAAGSIIGAAIGIVSGENIGSAAGKGAAVGAAAGATLGGAKTSFSNETEADVIEDFRGKSLENRAIEPKTIAHGFLFYPGEAVTAKKLRLQLIEEDTGNVNVINLIF
jgi:hypothetical protein